MSLSRREFLRAGSVCALSFGFLHQVAGSAVGQQEGRTPPTKTATEKVAPGSPVPFESQSDPLAYMTRKTFTQYLQTEFVIDPGYTFPLIVRLIEVKDRRLDVNKQNNPSNRECFSLTFRAPDDANVKQGTYRIKHDALGIFELYVIPSRDKQNRVFYEAIINRLEQ